MSNFVNISDRVNLNLALQMLQPEQLPHWGKMNAQNMVEHLIEAVEYSNGIRPSLLDISEEKAMRRKKAVFYSNFEIPANIDGGLSDATKGKRFKNLQEAIVELNRQLDIFHQYFSIAGQTVVHGGFGALNYEEWLFWHGKHFAHHFKQFGILQVNNQ